VTDACFNSLYYCDDEEGFRIFCWVDNNIVTMVSSIHTGEEKILRKRKRPRKNATNKNHLPQIFGDEAVAEIEIPDVVIDYNFKMKGVELSDQLIAYYCPQVRCRRYWLAMFFHGLDIVRVNPNVVASWEGDAESQKQYLREIKC